MANIKLKPKARKGIIDIKALVKHPMETGLRKNRKTGNFFPANYITDLKVAVNGNIVVNGMIGSAISKNPYFRFKVKGDMGDVVTLTYSDNQGKSDSVTKKSK